MAEGNGNAPVATHTPYYNEPPPESYYYNEEYEREMELENKLHRAIWRFKNNPTDRTFDKMHRIIPR
jgi:hypothetical protein